jgi:hypothetical protein
VSNSVTSAKVSHTPSPPLHTHNTTHCLGRLQPVCLSRKPRMQHMCTPHLNCPAGGMHAVPHGSLNHQQNACQCHTTQQQKCRRAYPAVKVTPVQRHNRCPIRAGLSAEQHPAQQVEQHASCQQIPLSAPYPSSALRSWQRRTHKDSATTSTLLLLAGCAVWLPDALSGYKV